MRWNIDRTSGSPQFLLNPVHYLLSKIKSNQSFSPPLNSTWITLNHSFLSLFPSHSLPPPAQASLRVILWYVVLLQYCQAYLTHLHSIRKRYWSWKLITWPSPWDPHLPHMSFRTEEGWRVAPRPRNLLWVHLSVHSSLCFPAVESWDCNQYVSVCSYAQWQPSHLNLFPECDWENRGLVSGLVIMIGSMVQALGSRTDVFSLSQTKTGLFH